MDTTHTPADTTEQETPGQDHQRGQGMVEYSLIVMLVALVLILAVQVLGHQTNDLYSNVAGSLASP